MEQKQGADDGDNDKLFQQFEAECVDSMLNELRAIVSWDDLNADWQAFCISCNRALTACSVFSAFLP